MTRSRTLLGLAGLLIAAALIIGFRTVRVHHEFPAPPPGTGWMDGGPVDAECGSAFAETQTTGAIYYAEECATHRGEHLALAALLLGAGFSLLATGASQLWMRSRTDQDSLT